MTGVTGGGRLARVWRRGLCPHGPGPSGCRGGWGVEGNGLGGKGPVTPGPAARPCAMTRGFSAPLPAGFAEPSA